MSQVTYSVKRFNLNVNFRNIEANSIIRALIINKCGRYNAIYYVNTQKKVSNCVSPQLSDLSINLNKIIVLRGELLRTTISVNSRVSLPYQLTYELYQDDVNMKVPFLFEENNNSASGIFDFRITTPGVYYLKALITNVCGQAEILTQNINVT